MRPSDRVATVAIAAGLGVAGCDTGVDLRGTYQVVAHTADATGCAALAPVADPPYVRLERQELLGQDYYRLVACTDPAQADCPGAGPYGLFAQPIDDGWRAELGLALTAGGCVLDYNRADAVRVDDRLVVDGFRYEDAGVRPEAECTAEMALELGDAMPCVGAEHLEAVRVAP